MSDCKGRHRLASERQKDHCATLGRLKRRHVGVAPVWRANVVYLTFQIEVLTFEIGMLRVLSRCRKAAWRLA